MASPISFKIKNGKYLITSYFSPNMSFKGSEIIWDTLAVPMKKMSAPIPSKMETLRISGYFIPLYMNVMGINNEMENEINNKMLKILKSISVSAG
jgi:hypothetical protein